MNNNLRGHSHWPHHICNIDNHAGPPLYVFVVLFGTMLIYMLPAAFISCDISIAIPEVEAKLIIMYTLNSNQHLLCIRMEGMLLGSTWPQGQPSELRTCIGMVLLIIVGNCIVFMIVAHLQDLDQQHSVRSHLSSASRPVYYQRARHWYVAVCVLHGDGGGGHGNAV